MTHTTSKSTQEQIVAEAKKITPAQRKAFSDDNAMVLGALKAKTGMQWGVAVEKARFTLQTIDFSGKKTVVTDKCEPMPFYEFAEFMRNYKA